MAQKASGVNGSVEILAVISSFPQLTRKGISGRLHKRSDHVNQFTCRSRMNGRQTGVRPVKLLKMIVWRRGTRSDRASHRT
jgi:hypothetical protein